MTRRTCLARRTSARLIAGLGLLTVATTIAACATGATVAATSVGSARPSAAARLVQRFRPPVPPTSAQRRQIVAALDDSDNGVPGILSESQGLERDFPARLRLHVAYTRLRPHVTRIRVSRSTPVLASAAVELRDRRGRQVLPTAIIVLSRNSGAGRRESARWSMALWPATSFPDSCGPVVEISIRELLCPSPWVVLGYRHHPGIPSGLGFTTPAGTANIRAVRWADVTVPGSACGAGRPIRLHHGAAFAEPAMQPWWPAVMVNGGLEAHGELAGRETAVIEIECQNGGGTADGQLGFAAVVYQLRAGLLTVIGVLTPRQPLSLVTPHVPILGRVTIRNGEVIADEVWYGPDDGTAGASGRAVTLWKLTGGMLRPFRTIIVRKPAS